MKLRAELLLTTMLAALALLSGCAKSTHHAPARGAITQASFATPEEAVTALVAAGERHDVDALNELLGRGTADLVSSGDPVADRRAREAFLARYRAYHELISGGPNDLVLVVGEDRWPFAIPLVRTDGRWFWDGAAGAPELVSQRIDANQRRTIEVMRSFVHAERTYAAVGHDGAPPGVYAQKLRSTPGKRDGLYWETRDGEPQSPAGPLLAAAAAEGYAVGAGRRAPFHGYVYRLLTSQGANASDGARDYIENGKLTGGFAALAYPDSYGSSGVMTFMVNQDGVVWQRDLGKDTAAAAAAIKGFNPDDRWTPIAPGESAATAAQTSATAAPIRSGSHR
jgi:Protein of unknown function (DUF2950)